MKKMLAIFAVMVVMAGAGWGAVPTPNKDFMRTMSIQGRVTNVDGSAITDGTYNMIFTLKRGRIGVIEGFTDAGWTETSSVTVNGGIFNAILGLSTYLPEFDSANYDYSIVITFNGDLVGEQTLHAVPLAQSARNVIGNNFSRISINSTATKNPISSKTTVSDGIAISGESTAGYGVAGKTGSANYPGVGGVGPKWGVWGVSTNTTVTGPYEPAGGLSFRPVGAVGGNASGLVGVSGFSNFNHGVYGTAYGWVAGKAGVAGTNIAGSGPGVLGEIGSTATGTSAAVAGINSRTTAGDNPGVYGESATGYGIIGKTSYLGVSDDNRAGVYGIATGSHGRGMLAETSGAYGRGLSAVAKANYSYAIEADATINSLTTGIYSKARGSNRAALEIENVGYDLTKDTTDDGPALIIGSGKIVIENIERHTTSVRKGKAAGYVIMESGQQFFSVYNSFYDSSDTLVFLSCENPDAGPPDSGTVQYAVARPFASPGGGFHIRRNSSDGRLKVNYLLIHSSRS